MGGDYRVGRFLEECACHEVDDRRCGAFGEPIELRCGGPHAEPILANLVRLVDAFRSHSDHDGVAVMWSAWTRTFDDGISNAMDRWYGPEADECILSTAYAGSSRGYDVVIVGDAVATATANQEAALQVARSTVAKVLTTDDVVDHMEQEFVTGELGAVKGIEHPDGRKDG